MSSGRGNAFTKTRRCPSTELLVLFSCGELSSKNAADQISQHLDDCGFCATELHLLAAHRPTQERYRPVQMPLDLRRLAQAVFSDGRRV